ncbi:hypothetical protein QBC46DRAFT_414880 [Diplogelasinospora grovesii]|uniref:Uncharacterized protein n=1 Tax=Diplogelasinospora grovesii TaxID=303347 RepID=A0AAN6NHX6_9PEZI|nr:hypothetical protein QBC46DRAFT_414880 [Diplogelasinospora grovesii]
MNQNSSSSNPATIPRSFYCTESDILFTFEPTVTSSMATGASPTAAPNPGEGFGMTPTTATLQGGDGGGDGGKGSGGDGGKGSGGDGDKGSGSGGDGGDGGEGSGGDGGKGSGSGGDGGKGGQTKKYTGEYTAAEAADVARQGGGSLMAWPADEPYVLPTLDDDNTGSVRKEGEGDNRLQDPHIQDKNVSPQEQQEKDDGQNQKE